MASPCDYQQASTELTILTSARCHPRFSWENRAAGLWLVGGSWEKWGGVAEGVSARLWEQSGSG